MRSLRPATTDDLDKLTAAIDHLRTARNLLTEVKAPRAVAAVRRALVSTEGAGRHLEHRIRRSRS